MHELRFSTCYGVLVCHINVLHIQKAQIDTL